MQLCRLAVQDDPILRSAVLRWKAKEKSYTYTTVKTAGSVSTAEVFLIMGKRYVPFLSHLVITRIFCNK